MEDEGVVGVLEEQEGEEIMLHPLQPLLHIYRHHHRRLIIHRILPLHYHLSLPRMIEC